MTLTAAGWSPPVTIINSPVTFGEISCGSPTLCAFAYVAPRDLSHVYVAMWDGKTWGTPTVLADPTAQATLAYPTCVGSTFCLLSDDIYTWQYRGSWSTVGPLPGLNEHASFGPIACSAPTSCLTTGHPATDLWNGSAWRQVAGSPLTTNGTDVVCPAATDCVATGGVGGGYPPLLDVSTWNGTSWSSPLQITPADGRLLEALQCPAPGSCVAVDYAGRVIVLRSGTWKAVGTLMGGWPKSQGTFELACTSVTSCLIPDTPGHSVLSFQP